MVLTALTKTLGTIYLLSVAALLLLFVFSVLRGRGGDESLPAALGLIFGWPLVLLNARQRRRLWKLVNPG